MSTEGREYFAGKLATDPEYVLAIARGKRVKKTHTGVDDLSSKVTAAEKHDLAAERTRLLSVLKEHGPNGQAIRKALLPLKPLLDKHQLEVRVLTNNEGRDTHRVVIGPVEQGRGARIKKSGGEPFGDWRVNVDDPNNFVRRMWDIITQVGTRLRT